MLNHSICSPILLDESMQIAALDLGKENTEFEQHSDLLVPLIRRAYVCWFYSHRLLHTVCSVFWCRGCGPYAVYTRRHITNIFFRTS
jgi:hypothetical protein